MLANEPKTKGAPAAVDRVLKKNSREDVRNYDHDAEAIAKVLVRHYGDEADAVLKAAMDRLELVRRTKR
ncbi:MAG TPA: hypothetical protein VFB99_23895 [Vicinamibacterales bacterium]|nr:hypothetical protein [Vicinamibacterales bacterium]